MGLDMYAYFVGKESVINDVDCRLEYGQVEDFSAFNQKSFIDWAKDIITD